MVYAFLKVISPFIDKAYIYGCISYHHTPCTSLGDIKGEK